MTKNIVFRVVSIDGQVLSENTSPGTKNYTVFSPENFDVSALNLVDLIKKNFKDPRVASVSLSKVGKHENDRSRHVAFPASDVVLVNNSLSDLLGEVSLDSVSDWCVNASNHGLFHIEVDVSLDLHKTTNFLSGDSLYHSLRNETSELNKVPFGANGRELDIAIDCSWLGETETGAQTLISFFIKSLTQRKDIGKIYLVDLPNSLPSYCRDRIDVSRVIMGSTEKESEVDIFWRPCQPDIFFDISRARTWAKRVVITYFDLIAYDIAAYHSSLNKWKRYREIQVRNGELADLVIAISDDVCHQLSESIPTINPYRIRKVGVGVDHVFSEENVLESHPSELIRSVTKDSYVLFLGTNYTHKNLPFARKVVEKTFLDGERLNLVIAGLDQNIGNSDLSLETSDSEYWLGSVDTADRNYLLANAELVIYPTSAEGFGLVPFEAASLGTPTLFTNFGPLAESFTSEFLPSNWELDSYVDSLQKLMSNDNSFRNQLISEVQSLAHGRLSWDNVTEDLVASFLYALELPSVYIDKTALAEIQNSLSWRITAPLRRIGRFGRVVRNRRRVESIRKITII